MAVNIAEAKITPIASLISPSPSRVNATSSLIPNRRTTGLITVGPVIMVNTPIKKAKGGMMAAMNKKTRIISTAVINPPMSDSLRTFPISCRNSMGEQACSCGRQRLKL